MQDFQTSVNERSPSKVIKSPKKWLHPNELMSINRLKRKKRALNARLNCSRILEETENSENSSENNSTKISSAKRHNPFVTNENVTKIKKISESTAKLSNIDDVVEQTIFEIFGSNDESEVNQTSGAITTFTNVLKNVDPQFSQNIKKIGEKIIPVDWSLKTKARIMCAKPFQWNNKRKTVEEASSITSFARCFKDEKCSPNIDSSPNTKLCQYSKYWQYPNLPWINLFPRNNKKITDPSFVGIPNCLAIRQNLHFEWIESIRSLFQLMRACQCPYFYVCVNRFTVLFRAAGIGGFSNLHVLLTPSSRGFRQLLRQEKIAFQMPLLQKKASRSNNSDTGYDSLDGSRISGQNDSLDAFVADIDGDSLHAEWLESVGATKEQIKKIQAEQNKIDQRSEHEIDNSEQSLILIDESDVNGFFNLLINCKSIISSTGPFAGIPPTLLAPVAFNNGSLKTLKIEESIVHMNESKYYSTEFHGPILPNFIQNMCNLLPTSHNYTITVADLNSTLPLAKTHSSLLKKNCPEENSISSEVFSQENLSDCGLNKKFLKNCCSLNANCTRHFDSLKFDKETETFFIY